MPRHQPSAPLDLPDDPKLIAEGTFALNDTFPPEIKGSCSIDKVTARGDNKAGYRCTLVASEVV